MSTEHWVEVKKDGQLIMHSDNDGWTFMNRGSEPRQWPVTLNMKTGAFDSVDHDSSFSSDGCLHVAVRELVNKGHMSFEDGLELLCKSSWFVQHVKWKYERHMEELMEKVKKHEQKLRKLR